ncbi:hypothetical protein [Clostridium kluyveri]|uniref:Uncharacterized protein n=2 Tax=Clostridium kluyveri TaxID=1534 RepID=A5N1J7_CLOK5|nr:hypothetical protein [Clostridium kluyveri]EDK34993.1 Hypothetical protein CKL_2985 [Clostridium kluyveri DSM 555]BAH07688.1 hypothetical protein CKR_2637 [Clostridium kluyveri NBRC 12016]
MENYCCPFDYYDDYYDDYDDYFRKSNVGPEAVQAHIGRIVLIRLKWHGTITACIDSHNRRTGVVTLTVFTHFGQAQLRIHYSVILRITPIHVAPNHGKMPSHENPSHGVMPSHGAQPNKNPNHGGWQGSNKDLK